MPNWTASAKRYCMPHAHGIVLIVHRQSGFFACHDLHVHDRATAIIAACCCVTSSRAAHKSALPVPLSRGHDFSFMNDRRDALASCCVLRTRRDGGLVLVRNTRESCEFSSEMLCDPVQTFARSSPLLSSCSARGWGVFRGCDGEETPNKMVNASGGG